MYEWLAPAAIGAIIAAIVSGVIQITGLFINHRNNLILERARRTEKIADFVIAIRSEVEANVGRFNQADLAANGEDVVARIEANPHYVPFVPRYATMLIFDEIIHEIHLLPSSVIAEVVTYYKAEDYISKFADDIRSDKYAALDQKLRATIYSDYTELLTLNAGRAFNLIETLDKHLKEMRYRPSQ